MRPARRSSGHNACQKSGKKAFAPPHIFEALRWQGLNLASLDSQLGHYFGTEKGVVVICSGSNIKNLSGDNVILRIETTTTQSPRDVMPLLREKKVGEKVQLSVLRDRKVVNIEITTPKQEHCRSCSYLQHHRHHQLVCFSTKLISTAQSEFVKINEARDGPLNQVKWAKFK